MLNHLPRCGAVLALLCAASPAPASRWVEIGTAGVSTDKVLVDADSIEKADNFRLANVMTLSSAPQTNSHNITYDRRVNKVAFNCADRTFQSVQMIAYLGEKRVGSSPENTNWRNSMKAVGTDGLNNRALALVCAAAVAGGPAAEQKPRISSGSGIVVDGVGDILTASHVVSHCKSIAVKTATSNSSMPRSSGSTPRTIWPS